MILRSSLFSLHRLRLSLSPSPLIPPTTTRVRFQLFLVFFLSPSLESASSSTTPQVTFQHGRLCTPNHTLCGVWHRRAHPAVSFSNPRQGLVSSALSH